LIRWLILMNVSVEMVSVYPERLSELVLMLANRYISTRTSDNSEPRNRLTNSQRLKTEDYRTVENVSVEMHFGPTFV